jgi:hypothetical protein
VAGLISVPIWMQCFAQDSMQRPHPLQYWGTRTGRTLSWRAVVAIGSNLPLGGDCKKATTAAARCSG